MKYCHCHRQRIGNKTQTIIAGCSDFNPNRDEIQEKAEAKRRHTPNKEAVKKITINLATQENLLTSGKKTKQSKKKARKPSTSSSGESELKD